MTNEAGLVYEAASAHALPSSLVNYGWGPDLGWYLSIGAMPIACVVLFACAWRAKAKGRRMDWAKPGIQLASIIQAALAMILLFNTVGDLLWSWGTGKRLMWESGTGWQAEDKVVAAIRLAHAFTSLSLRVGATACCLVLQICLPHWRSRDQNANRQIQPIAAKRGSG